jgi:hypothetical protein
MLFFRSEERVLEWCRDHSEPLRPRVRLDQLWSLSVAWYATRLRPDSRRPGAAEMRSIFAGLGLTDSFWDPESDAFSG